MKLGCRAAEQRRARRREARRAPESLRRAEASVSREALYNNFTLHLGRLRQGLKTVEGGELWVSLIKGPDPVTTAKTLIKKMTPKHLGHNGPLMTNMKRSLVEYEPVEERYQAALSEQQAVYDRIFVAKRRLQICLWLLDSAVQQASWRKALTELESKGRRKAA